MLELADDCVGDMARSFVPDVILVLLRLKYNRVACGRGVGTSRVGLGAFLVLVILVFGGSFEKAIDRRWPGRGTTDSETRSTTRAPSSEM
jgi:hypothetical protein